MQKIARNVGRYYLLWLPFVVAAILFTATSKPNVVAQTSAVAKQDQPVIDIVQHEGELLRLTVDYPREIRVENISNRQISNFTVEMSDPTWGGISNPFAWGAHPHFAKQEKLLKPGEVVTMAIPQQYVNDFAGKPRLEARVGSVFMDNDETIMWRNGFFLRQDPNDWTQWRRSPVLREIGKEAKEREAIKGAQDYTSNEKPN